MPASKEQLNLAKQSLSKGKFQQALQYCSALMSDPETSFTTLETLYIAAVAHRYLKQYEQAHSMLVKLLQLEPEHARALQERGYVYLATHQKSKAAKSFYDATLINPALDKSWSELNKLYSQFEDEKARQYASENWHFWSQLPAPVRGAADLLFSGQSERADGVCRQFLQNEKHHPDALYVLALIDIHNLKYDEAEFLLESCCELAPDHRRARAEMGALLNRVGKYQAAADQASLLLNEHPENLNYQVLEAVALVGLGEVEAGKQVFERVLELEPSRASLWLQLGHAEKSLGNFESAIRAYKQAIQQRHDYGDAYWSLANTKSYVFSMSELTNMAELVEQPSLTSEDRIHLCFALGKGYEDNNDANSSFRYFHKGNTEKYQASDFDPDRFSEQVKKSMEFFTESFFEAHSETGCQNNAPIFILGLPRAGSTLIEQIISAHSKVDATQELHNVLSLAKRLRRNNDYPDMLNGLDDEFFERFGQQFIEQTQAYRKDGEFFIDKMPNNYLHIGLIKLILPNAKVIDARRNAMDCCYSCYKQLFAEGQDFTYSLDALGRYYTDYVRLMEHWDKVLPEFVLRVDHEHVLDDLEGQVHRILSFCGLEFEQSCVEFHKHKRAIQTPSAAQVLRPINRDGVDKWRNVESELEPLKRALGIVG